MPLMPNAFSPQLFCPSVSPLGIFGLFWLMKECRCLSCARRAPATAPLRIPVPGAAPHGCTHININDTAPPLM